MKTTRFFDAAVEYKTPPEGGTLDADPKVSCVVTTQTKISNHLFDKEGNPVDEYLLTRGARFPESKKVPLFYGHDYRNLANDLGSVTNLRVSGDKVRGDMDFSKSRQDAKQLVNERHLNGVSVGMEPVKAKFVKADDSEIFNEGADDELYVSGPAVVYQVWDVYEVSATPVPANRECKIGFNSDNSGNVYFWEKRTKKRKRPIDTPEPLSVGSQSMEPKVEVKAPETVEASVETKPETVSAVNVKEEQAKAKQFLKDVLAECKRFSLDCAEELVSKYDTIQDVKNDILDRVATRQKESAPLSISFGSTGEEKLAKAQGDAMTYVLIQAAKRKFSGSDHNSLVGEKMEEHLPKNVDENMKNMRFSDFCAQQLERQGVNVRYGMSRQDVIKRAIKSTPNHFVERFSNQFSGGIADGYLSTGDVLPLLQDALHKVQIASYEAALTSWQLWVKSEGSTSDLKNFHFPQLSGAGYLDVKVEGQGVPIQKQMTATDAIMNINVRANQVSIPWEVIANDDLGAMAYIPSELGKSANKTINLVCFNELLNGAPMDEDSAALFGSHTNTYGTQSNDLSDGSPTSTSVSNMMTTMTTFLGRDGTPIRLQPKFLVVPWKYHRQAETVCLSQYDVTQNNANGDPLFQAYNTFSALRPVADPLLDQYNTNAGSNYYFLMPTIEDSPLRIVFLSGEEQPVTSSFIDLHTDALVYKVRQTYGVRAIDYRRVIREH